MKKLVKSFQEPLENKRLDNYVKYKHRNRASNQPIEADLERPWWWHDPGYDMHGRPIPEPEEASGKDEVWVEIYNQRFRVLEDGDVDFDEFEEDEKNWVESEYEGEYLIRDGVSAIQDAWDIMYDVIEFPEEPGVYRLNAYFGLTYDIDGAELDERGHVDGSDWAVKFLPKESKVQDVTIEKVN